MQLGDYEHYKGKRYKVIGVAKHSETLEDLVIYRALYESKEFGDNAMWVRPMSMFLDNVVINGQQIPRFKYIGGVNSFCCMAGGFCTV